MASLNNVVLLGRLTRDPELRKTTSGISHCRFTVACDRPKQKDDQEQTADFINCTAWRQNAEFICNYAEKGSMVAVNGSIQTGSYTDKDGRKIYTTDILANRIQLVESKKQRSEYPSNGTSYTMEEAGRAANEGFETGSGGVEIGTDDLPF